jgi:thioredoxin reductase (NADPH)
MLNVPGENLPHVSHYYDEPFKYSYTNVVLVGGSNSSVEAALELYRHDAHVTIVHKEADFRTKVKYWLVPDVKNRVKEGKIHTRFNSVTGLSNPEDCKLKTLKPAKRSGYLRILYFCW